MACGAAPVLIRTGSRCPRVLKLHLGTADEHTVYGGEIVGSVLEAELLRTATHLLRWTAPPPSRSCGHVQATIRLTSFATCRRLPCAHEDMDEPGNALPDDEAKMVARGGSSTAACEAPQGSPMPCYGDEPRSPGEAT